MTRRIAVLVSGRGSNLRAIASAVRNGTLDAKIGTVISNRRDAAGLLWAQAEGIEALFIDPGKHPNREAYDDALADALRARDIGLVCLAGFMRLVGRPLLEAFHERILNIHPSLLPAFPGLNAQRQALDYGVGVTGATVHFVTEGLDEGPIVIQAAVPVLPGDTEDTLSARILVEEHRIYPEAIRRVFERRWRILGRRFDLLD